MRAAPRNGLSAITILCGVICQISRVTSRPTITVTLKYANATGARNSTGSSSTSTGSGAYSASPVGSPISQGLSDAIQASITHAPSSSVVLTTPPGCNLRPGTGILSYSQWPCYGSKNGEFFVTDHVYIWGPEPASCSSVPSGSRIPEGCFSTWTYTSGRPNDYTSVPTALVTTWAPVRLKTMTVTQGFFSEPGDGISTTFTSTVDDTIPMTRYSLINYLRCQLNAVDCPDPVKAKPTATLDAEARSSIERARGAGCKGCSILFPSVQIRFFPPDPTDALLPSPGATISPPASLAKVGDVISSATVNYTVGPDGFTYSYPSLYVNFGNVSATDECGYVVGNTHSSVTLAFAPGELSTIMAMGLGGWIVTATRRIDVGNLTTSARPQIAFPTKLKEIDPAWKSCSANLWQGLDPPIALTRQAGMTSPLKVLIPVAALDPATTSAAPAMQGTLAATPNSFPELPAQQTSLPQTTSVRTLAKGDSSGAPGAGPAVAPVDPKAPAPIDPPAEVQSGSDLPKVNEPPVLDYVSQPGPSQPPKRGPAESQGQPRPLRQGESLEPSFNPGQYNIQAPAVIVQGQTISEDSPATVVAGNTVAVSSGSIYVGSQAAPLPTAAFPERQSPGSYPAPVVVGGLTFSFSPAGPRTAASPAVAVAGQEVVPAVESATVAGQAVSIAPGGGIVIGGSTPLTPGAAALTVSGTPVSLNPSALVIGSSTVPLPTPAAPAAAVFTFAGQVVTANPTVVPIAPGTTLYPGGPAVTISGVALSLGPSGRLVIGSTTLRLSSASTTVTSSRGSSLSTPLSSSSSLSTSEPPPPKKGAASSVTMRLSWLDTCWWGVLLALWAVWL